MWPIPMNFYGTVQLRYLEVLHTVHSQNFLGGPNSLDLSNYSGRVYCVPSKSFYAHISWAVLYQLNGTHKRYILVCGHKLENSEFAILLPFFTHQLKPMIFTAPIPGVGVMGRLFFAYSTCCDMFVCVGKNFTATGPSKIHVWVPWSNPLLTIIGQN